MTAKSPPEIAATFHLNSRRKRQFFVLGALGLAGLVFGLSLAVIFRDPVSDAQYAAEGTGEWCLLVGFWAVLVGVFGSVLNDYTIRPLQRGLQYVSQWINSDD